MKSLNKLLDEALCAFASASEQHATAKQQTSEARNQETHWLNKVNEAQKVIDELITTLKKEAPRDSDWQRATIKQLPV